MINFIGLVIYIITLILSLFVEAGILINDRDTHRTLDWLYSALVVLAVCLPMPYWVLRPAFVAILFITLIRTIITPLGYYTSTVERIDSGVCAIFLALALAHVIRHVVIPSL